MPELRFDVWDIFKAPKLAWSYRKMYVAIRGILFAWFIYSFVTYISLLLTPSCRAIGLTDLFRYFEFFPVLLPEFNGTWQYIVYCAGIIMAILSLLTTATAVARIAYEDVCGNDVFQVKEALRFAKHHRATVYASVASLGGLFLVFPITAWLWGIVGKIPSVGELIFSITSLPFFFWGLLGASIFVVFCFGLVLIPAIIACSDKDVLETVIETFSSVLSHPCRLIIFETAAKIVSIVYSLLLVAFSLCVALALYFFSGLFLGNTLNELINISLYRIPGAVDITFLVGAFFERCDIIPFLSLMNDTANISTTVRIAGWIHGLSILMIIAWIASYSLSVLYSSQILIYLAIRKRKNGLDLRLKQPPTDFTPEVPQNM